MSAEGMNLLLAVRDYAQSEAAELEQEAAALQTKASEMKERADVLRRIHAVAAPYFPAQSVRMLKEASA